MSCPNSKYCDGNGDVRGMCFTCTGDFDDMTVNQLRKVMKCPNTPYAMAFWIHNNHHELWEKIQNDMDGEQCLKEWISCNSLIGLELLFKYMEEEEREEFWRYTNEMEDDEDKATVYEFEDGNRVDENGCCKGCNKCPKNDD